MTGQLTKTGTVSHTGFLGPIVFTLTSPLAWCERVELILATPGAKTRQARVFARMHGGSQVFSEVFALVRVPASLGDHEAAHAAIHAAHHRLKGYSWVMWTRARIADKYASLVGDPAFSRSLRMLSTEWCPRESAEGRDHIAKVLKLGDFDASAYPVSLSHA